MRPSLLALLAVVLAGGSADAGERSFGFVHVGRSGSISQSLATRVSAGRVSSSSISYRNEPREARRVGRRERGYRPIDRDDARFDRRGSFLYVSHGVNPVDRPYIPSLDDVAYGGSGTYDPDFGRSRVYGRGYGDDRPAPSFPSEPKIINIEAERLDRHPVGPSGIEVINTGGAKIIRIAPGYSSTGRRQASAAPSPQRVTGYLQPWSEAWMKHCIAAHPSFDPELGTYADGGGRIRFCSTGE